MNGDNPYAPPAVSEPDSVIICSGNGWKLLDDILLVPCGGVLPMVDLRLGICDHSLQPTRLSPASMLGSLLSRDTRFVHSYASTRTRIGRIVRSVRGLLFIVALFVLPFTGQYPQGAWFPFALFGTVFVWGFFDKPGLAIEDSVTPGWLRITNLHPSALAYLREIADKKELRYYPQSP